MASSIAPMFVDHGGEGTMTAKRPTSRGGWTAAIFIIFMEVAERFAYYGVAGNLIMYLMKELEKPLATAAQNVNIWVGVSAIFPLIGAFLADSYLGRFRTILISSVIFLLGMVLITVSVSEITPNEYRSAMFFTSLYIIAVGEGGHKPCVQTFAADQFDEDLPEEKMAKSSFFNWWYLGIVFGATSAVFVAVYLQDHVGWTVGFGVLGAAVAIALALFLVGIKTYRRQGPLGSPFTRLAQVFVAAAKKWRLEESPDGNGICLDNEQELESQNRPRTLARTKSFRYLDKAMIIDNIDMSSKTRDPWRLCSLNQVEEVKLILRLIPVWLSCLMFAVVQAQAHTFFTKQGSVMVRSIGPHFAISPANLQGIIGIAIMIFVPIYDRVFVPLARRITGRPSGITILQRIGIGLFLSILNMVVSGLVEFKRVNVAREHGLIDNPKATVPIRIWWLLPQYMICGLSDVFTVVGMQELFYDQMPETWRSFGAAEYTSVVGVGSLISGAIIPLVQSISLRIGGTKWLSDNLNYAHLDDYYWVLAGLSGLNLCIYIYIAKGFVYKKVHG